jgi:sugar-specific transcriptional regulator TrmB
MEPLDERLRGLGLSEYEREAYIALLAHGALTGLEVARRSNVPQPKVYDAMLRLQRKGLVSIIKSRPQRFVPEEAAAAIRSLAEEQSARLRDAAEKAIDSLRRLPPRRSGVEVARLEQHDVGEAASAQVVGEADAHDAAAHDDDACPLGQERGGARRRRRPRLGRDAARERERARIEQLYLLL